MSARSALYKLCKTLSTALYGHIHAVTSQLRPLHFLDISIAEFDVGARVLLLQGFLIIVTYESMLLLSQSAWPKIAAAQCHYSAREYM